MPELKPTPEFITCLRVLVGLYSEFKLTPQVIESYWIILADIPPDLLKAATLQIAANPETNFFPRAAAIRLACFALVENENDTITPDAAWIEVLDAMGTHGYLRTPEFSAPIILMALGGGRGWRALCASDQAQVSYHRTQFIKAFDSYIGRERYNVRMLPQVRALAAKYAGHAPALTSGAHAPQLTEGE